MTGEAGPSTGALSVGQILDGRYRIDAVLGEGGLGVVYRAEHVGLGRPAAIKVLHPHLGGVVELRQRFAREAKALSTLVHPHIVAIADFGEADGVSFLAMELLEGHTLEDLLKKGPPDPDLALDVFAQMLEGIAFAHDRGILHRDIKPGNVFLQERPDGTHHVKLVDFGLAKIGDGGGGQAMPTLTRLGTVLGTPSYMSPEQGISAAADTRSDVYSLGIVLFELLTGRVPFDADTPGDMIRAHLTQDLPDPEKLRSGLKMTRELRSLLMKSLAKRKEDRFAGAGEMLAELRALPSPAATIKGAKANGKPKPARAPLPPPPPAAEKIADPSVDETVLAGPPREPKTVADRPQAPVAMPREVRSRAGCIATVLILPVVGLVAAGAWWLWSPGTPSAADDGGGEIEAVGEDAIPETPPEEPMRGSGVRNRTAGPPPGETPTSTRTAGTGTETTATESTAETTTDATAATGADAPVDRLARVPRALRGVYTRVRRGQPLTERQMKFLRDYQQDHRDDAAASVILGHDHVQRNWIESAIDRYEIAHRLDPASRGTPWMRDDIIAMAAGDVHERKAADLVVRVYGAEAIPLIDAALARGNLAAAATARLQRLRVRLARRRQ